MANKLLTAALLWLCLLASAHAAPALVLGVVPYMSARKLATLYEPLRAGLERSLQQPVTLESAADYGFSSNAHARAATTSSPPHPTSAAWRSRSRITSRWHGHWPTWNRCW
ncbi:hypothetical protein ACFSQE_03580 [Vogesella fluminis]|uniref:hypothetical protein n=1 Tax=Vogesella fluminis TaxID=1069161 RepID=UPI003644CE50